ncbi:MAG TPA: 2-oxoglutarate and iron-dependent oxygenase domain-containing protein [Rhodopila sp.]
MSTTLAPSIAAIRSDAPEEIPILDLGPYLAGAPGARAALGRELRHALEQVGFYFVVNHGVAQSLIDATFAAVERFHAQPEDAKRALLINRNNVGYLPFKGSTIRHSQLNQNNRPDLNEAFFVKRDLPADHPDVIADKMFRGTNKWPAALPGFRETVNAYCGAMEGLATSLLPLYAEALELSPSWFDSFFSDPMYTLRMSHYPKQDASGADEFGIAPHTDTSFMTLLAQNRIPGLSIRLPNGNWVDAPTLPGSILVNGGDMLRRWTNDRCLATPHRVINRSGEERYAIPFFFDCNYDAVMECVPTCCSDDMPPRYTRMTYPEYMTWYRDLTYGAARQDAAGR